MRGFIFGLTLLVSSFYSLASSDIVQGPFKVDADSSVYIKRESDINYPLALYFDANGNDFKVESYEVDGGEPHVETVFLSKINNKKNVIVLISWEQRHSAEKINGTAYQVYGYNYSLNTLSINPSIKNDQNLNGLDGEFNGEVLHFKYKDAAKIKAYLQSHYK
ncbi:hypothetical protein [Enterobacter kobei]|uniref:hypothetical protein n=1 Tax=Enterobacter kobei TaxID=208224 RepID=UPI0020039D60|nr:hypothetical protein [Enterobacter kobei]MCK6889667.1 hypothetical protein [Enterobacter kobei]